MQKKSVLIATTTLCALIALPHASLAASSDPAVVQFTSEKRAEAVQLEAQGDIPGALVIWRLVAAADRSNDEARQAVKRLENEAEQRAKTHLANAESAFNRGQSNDARTLYLKTLAYDPGNATATSRLRELERRNVLANQDKKDEKALAEYRASQTAAAPAAAGPTLATLFRAAKYKDVVARADSQLAKNAGDKDALDHKVRALIALAQQRKKVKDYKGALGNLTAATNRRYPHQTKVDELTQEVRTAYASQLYGQGLTAMNSDLDRAIELLQAAIEMDPTHLQASTRLVQAQKMRERLKAFE